MDILLAKQQVSETGRMLLEKELVARTWGNFSAKIDDDSFAITPSGFGYEKMQPDDVVICNMDGTYIGTRKPSSENGIHKAAYQIFSDIGFVIHTHQIYATAISLTGEKSLNITDSEKQRLGGIAFAKYGLPGTEKLWNNVSDAFKKNAQTVFMQNHGVLICAKDRAEAIERAELLEEICKKSCRYDGNLLINKTLIAQLDDMAQMIGRTIPYANSAKVADRLLQSHDVVFLKDNGLLYNAKDRDDLVALKLLAEKAIISEIHTQNYGKHSYISLLDCIKMRRNYLTSYSKKKSR